MNQVKIGAGLSYLSLLLGNVLAIIYTPFLIRMMGESEYGLYSLVLSIIAYLALMDFGFASALIRYISIFRLNDEKEKLPSLIGLFVSLYSIIGLICFFAGMGIYLSTERIFGSSLTEIELSRAKIMILFMVIYMSVSFPLSIFGAVIVAYEKFIFQKLLAIARTILTPILMLPLLIWGYKSIAMISVMITIGLIISFSNVWFCFYRIKVKVSFKNFDLKLLREIFWFSFFIFIKIVLERIYWSSGQFILGANIGTAAIALFSIALQMKGYYESFSQSITNLFLPRLTAMVSKKASASLISETFIKVGRIQFHIIGFILCVYILLGEPFIRLWAGQNYLFAYEISLFIMIPYTIPLIQSIGYLLVQAHNVQKPVVLIFAITTFTVILLSFFLVEDYGIKGCAIALSIAIVIGEILIMNWFYWKKLKLNIPFFWKEIVKIAITMCLISTIYHMIFSSLKIFNFAELLLYVMYFSILYFPLIYLFAMNSYERNLFLSFTNIVKLNKRKLLK